MSEKNLPATQTPTQPAITLLSIRIGTQELDVSDKAKQLLLTRTPGGWEMQEVAALGNNSVFVRRDATGMVRLVRKAIKLSVEKKEVVSLQGSFIITVPGYNKLNQVAGLQILTPPSIIVNGIEHSNPFVEYQGSEIKRVIARKIAIGYSPIGNLVAVDTVRHYNFDAYYLQDLHAKTKIKDAAQYGTSIVCPFDSTAEVAEKNGQTYARKDSKVWIFKVLKDMEGIWINPSHDEIKDVYKQHIQHQKFGDVISQNLATRNAMKAHPAIASSQVSVVNGVADVVVFGYRHDMNRDQIEDLGTKIIKGEELKDVQVIRQEGEASFEEIVQASETEMDESAAPSPDVTTAGTETDNVSATSPDSAALVTAIRKVAVDKNLDLDLISKNVFKNKFVALTDDQLMKMKSVVDNIQSTAKSGNQGGGK